MLQRPWLRALAWLAFLGPLFFITYNFANSVAGGRTHVPVLMFSWERYIPFIAWSIIPYWSSDLLYALSLAVCRTRAELDLHGKRLVAIQLFSTTCFLLLPLRCTFTRPALTGLTAALFDALLSFDRPFNQAPSLHVSLAVILWIRFRAHAHGLLRWLTAAWLSVVCISTLTTYQHHFIDVPTGLWAGLLILAALPERRLAGPYVRLSLLYLTGALVCTVAAFTLQGFVWILLWPGFALSMVAAAYWSGDSVWLAKRFGFAAFWMWPYMLAAWWNSRLWTAGQPSRHHVADGVWIGRAPSRAERHGVNSIVHLAAELPLHAEAYVPMLDLVVPRPDQIDSAVAAIDALQLQRPTLVCCALGYQRSAVACAAWLVAAGHADGVDGALAHIRAAHPHALLTPHALHCLRQWDSRRNGHAQS